MSNTIVFVHGMFQNPKSWSGWARMFMERGFKCVVPAWPDHAGEPATLRERIPETLGDLSLDDVLAAMTLAVSQATTDGTPPIVIGHSVGGLIVQILASKGLIQAGVAIEPVAPNRMMTLDWPFFRNVTTIVNPFKGDQPQLQTPESFHAGFCNTLDEAAARRAFEETATHDSRNVLRGCLGKTGHIDNLDQPHVPLLFVSGSEDQIIPADLVAKNASAWSDKTSVVDYRDFAGKSHFICNEPGWEDVANFVAGWLQAGVKPVRDTQRMAALMR